MNACHSDNTSIFKKRCEGLQFEFAMVLRMISPDVTHPDKPIQLSLENSDKANIILTDEEWQQLQDRTLNDKDGNPIPVLFSTS